MFVGLGELAAFITAITWASSCQIHTLIARQVGATSTTVARVPMLIGGMAVVCLIFGVNTATPTESVLFLALSAVAGITICDTLFYFACIEVGPRLAVLVQSTSACLTALFGYFLLGENIGLQGMAGILVATGGIGFVLSEGGVPSATAGVGSPTGRQLRRGIVFALTSATFQAISYLSLKQAVRTEIDPVWASLLRITMGSMCIWLVAAVRGKLISSFKGTWSLRGVPKLLLFGCIVSTIGNALAVVAMKYTASGVVAMLIGLQPVVIIPIVTIVERKLPSLRAIIGTLIAFSGVALVLMR